MNEKTDVVRFGDIIGFAKAFAEPWKKTTIILSILLCVSMGCNVYLSSKKTTVKFSANKNIESVISQKNK